MIALPPRPPARRNETRDLTRPIRAALNRLPGVRVVRNTDRGVMVPYHARLDPDPPHVLVGLGEGGADLVGIVSVLGWLTPDWPAHEPQRGLVTQLIVVGRAFALEIKWPGKRPRADQVRWLAAFRRFGGFAGVAHDLAEALAAVDRCRAGAAQ